MRLRMDACSPVPRQLTPPLAQAMRDGGPRDQASPSLRERANASDPDPVAHAIEDLRRSGYRPLRPSPGGA